MFQLMQCRNGEKYHVLMKKNFMRIKAIYAPVKIKQFILLGEESQMVIFDCVN